MRQLEQETFRKAPIRPGHWRWVTRQTGPDETEEIIKIGCPECGKAVTLEHHLHTVEQDGAVSPSLICPVCGWHDHARLKGYAP